MSRKPKIGLALASGGARGVAHIGVLQVLHQKKIPIHTIAGSSAGAIIGAMYAATLDPDWVEKRFREYLNSEKFMEVGTHHLRKGSQGEDSFFNQLGRLVKDKLVITFALSRKGIIDREKLKKSIKFLIPVRTFSDLKIPLIVVATDLNSGSELVLSTGDLVEAVVESSSIPGFISPLVKKNQILVDGGVCAPLPINCLSNLSLNFIIAVDIARREMDSLGDFNLIDLIVRTEQVTSVQLSTELSNKADIVIKPNVAGAHWSDFHRFDEFLENGRKAALDALPALKEQINKRYRWTYFLRKWIQGVA